MLGVAILGLGVVGSGVMKMLSDNKDRVAMAAGEEVKPLYGVDIRDVAVPEGVRRVSSLDEALSDEDVKLVVETIGGVRIAYEYTKKALSAGRWVATSNKELVATRGDELMLLAKEHGAEYLFEASVGGGVPILRPLNDCLSGNRLLEIDGIVNGSTNYLLTRMEDSGVAYPAALAEAKELGYVEANPDADVEGWDARRKLAILANAAFGSRFSDEALIPTEGISRVTDRDILCCRAFGGTVKLIAHACANGETWSGWVHPAFVTPDSPLSAVRDVYNGIVVRGDFVGDVMFYGRGAGSLATASAVVGDLIDAARHVRGGLRRNAFAGTPVFAKDMSPVSAALRVEAEDALSAQERVEEALPGCHVRPLDGMLAVKTAPMPFDALKERVARLSGDGMRAGLPIRML
jgi:homoserine dehydrogenase